MFVIIAIIVRDLMGLDVRKLIKTSPHPIKC
jgi:hypothetical protein